MPCRDTGPGEIEQKFLLLERHIKWLEGKLNKEIAETHNLPLTYKNLDYLTDSLCSAIQSMSEMLQNTIIYNGRDPYARRVADWWDQHLKMDMQRLKRKGREEAK